MQISEIGTAKFGITPSRRELMFNVMDGDNRVLPMLYQLNNFQRCDEIFRYLIRNNLTGRELIFWFNETFQGSFLNLVAHCLKKIDRDVMRRPLHYHKDMVHD